MVKYYLLYQPKIIIAYVFKDNNLTHYYNVYMCCVAAGLDVDRVCREMDVQALQQNISNVTFCDVASEASEPLCVGLCKNFLSLTGFSRCGRQLYQALSISSTDYRIPTGKQSWQTLKT